MPKDIVTVEKISLAFARAQRLMTQEELVDAADIGVATISRVERGDGLTMLTAQKILRALNLKGEELQLEPLGLDDLNWTVKRR